MEEQIFTLANNAKYLILHDLGEIESKRYLFAVGLSSDDLIDVDDNVFLEFKVKDDKEFVEKVDPNSEIYQALLQIELMDSAIGVVSGAKNRVEEYLKRIEENKSGI